ncbi:MAG: trypsin-like peptidase domain-containing protein, partial [Pirellulaceae bacterium]|nr:trypsin-like peptidase domain-containing protein [Pirellulaceae bacterium]
MRLTENRFHPGHLLLVATVVVTCLVETRLQASPKRRTPIVEAYERVSHAVVNIHGRKRLPADTIVSAEDFRQVNGMGTGVVIDERGYILTNSHVVDGVANIQVSFVDETSTTARLVANDPASDLAVIKINLDRKFPAIPVGTSHDLMRGEPVIAIGNAFGYTHTVSNGIISALHRSVKISDTQEYRNLIQTNASINPGNSGGPLLNIDGEMIGINVAVRVGAQGIGFALPVDDAMQVAAKLLTTRRIDDTTHGVIGETVREGTLAEAKFVVKRVESGSPAAKAGLKKGDVVVEVDRREIVRSLDFERALLGREQGEEIPVQVDR